jgi:hypothetical protein
MRRRGHRSGGWGVSDETTSVASGATSERRHLSRAVLGAAVVSLYAVWMAADLVARWLLFPVVAVLTGYLLYEQPTARAQTVFVGYAVAVMLVVTPILMIVPDLTGGFDASPSSRLFTTANVVLSVLFVVVAGVVAYVTYRLGGGRGIVARIRGVRSE